MRIFLSGPMGTGKSTVAAEVARAAGLACFDLDKRIEAAEGHSVSELFAARGEVAFRDLEAREVEVLIAAHADCVVALGGGTVTREATRRKLLSEGALVTLMAPVEELARRLGTEDSGRPLLKDRDVAKTLHDLIRARRGAYAECHATVQAMGEPERVAARVLDAVRDDAVLVALGERSYPVVIAAGARARLRSHLLAFSRAPSRVLLVTDTHVGALHGHEVEVNIAEAGIAMTRVELEPGESAKHIGSVKKIWEAALTSGVDRDALVIGLGGGVVGDLAGFAAATILRGVDVVHLPTTLLAMVDSAIGGKTGFDTPQGKNLIGAFHQPRFVLSDVELLETLPLEERRSGLAEVVKSAWLDGEPAVAQLERDAKKLVAGDVAATVEAVRMAAALKARVVSADEHEGGQRAWLNLGHTVGHAIEASMGYQGMRHGEAVALGMVAAFRLAHTFGAAREHLDRITSLLTALGLPTNVDAHLSAKTLAFMASDKKRGGGKLKFVVPGAPGQTEVVPLALDDIGVRVRAE